MTLADLADEVAISVHEKPLDQIEEEDVTWVFLSLYHTHIPMLLAADMVTHDRSQALVGIGKAAEEAVPFLSLVDDKAANVA